MNKALCSVAACVLAAFPTAAGAQRDSVLPISAWSDRGMFGFRNITLDFFYGRFRTGLADGPLVDCSNEIHRCMDSQEFRLVLPRACDELARATVGTVWSVGEVRTEVLGIENEGVPSHGATTGRKLYLGSPERPHVMYQYDPGVGVQTILWDFPGGFVDFRQLAREGSVARWLYGWGEDRAKANRVFPITTLDPFGRCGPNTPLGELRVDRPTSVERGEQPKPVR